MHLVFEQDSTCGLRKIAHFLELTQLDRVVAASYGAQQAYATGVTEQINERRRPGRALALGGLGCLKNGELQSPRKESDPIFLDRRLGVPGQANEKN